MRKRKKPIVKNDLLLTEGDAVPGASNTVRVGSRRWYAWLVDNPGFIFQGGAGHFTARREMRRGIPYWYAYRSREGKFSKTYLGKSAELTQERLEQAMRAPGGADNVAPVIEPIRFRGVDVRAE